MLECPTHKFNDEENKFHRSSSSKPSIINREIHIDESMKIKTVNLVINF